MRLCAVLAMDLLAHGDCGEPPWVGVHQERGAKQSNQEIAGGQAASPHWQSTMHRLGLSNGSGLGQYGC